MTNLVLSKLRKEFGAFAAVNGLDLEIAEGETVALLGPSGCGKTTTLNMIAGLLQPSGGDILIDGQSVVGVPAGQRNVGLVFQDYAVFMHMTVRRNLGFGLMVRGMARVVVARAVEEVAGLLRLEADLDRPARDLGSSQLQRVAIGRTLVTKPAILLLDEPLSNLESTLRNQMRRELRRVQAETRQTIIYVTHDQIEALSLAHRIAVMNQGDLQQFDTAHDTYHFPANRFVGSFLGNPPMNFIEGIADGGALRCGEAVLPLPDGVARAVERGRQLVVGLRAEAMTVVPVEDPTAFKVTVLAIEPQGPETVVTADFGGQSLKVVAPAGLVSPSEKVLVLRPRRGHMALFDAATGVRLGTGAA